MVGWSVGRSVGLLVVWLVGGLVGRSVGGLVFSWLVGWLVFFMLNPRVLISESVGCHKTGGHIPNINTTCGSTSALILPYQYHNAKYAHVPLGIANTVRMLVFRNVSLWNP